MLVELATILVLQTTPIKNPSVIGFNCPDHALDNEHEVDIIRESDGVVIQTLLIGDPPEVSGEVVAKINVQPVAFGSYRLVVRAVAGESKSDNSNTTEIWERTPGKPTNAVVR